MPTEISPWLESAASTLTTSSGELVPNATMVKPTIRRLRPARSASDELPLTRPSAPTKRRTSANAIYTRLASNLIDHLYYWGLNHGSFCVQSSVTLHKSCCRVCSARSYTGRRNNDENSTVVGNGKTDTFRLDHGFYPITADMPKKRLNFSKGECWSIRLNVRFATVAFTTP